MDTFYKRTSYEIGQRYHNFILIDKVPRKISKSGLTYINWLCRCDCGSEFVTTTKQIRKGKKSCGCLSKSHRFKAMSSEHVVITIKHSHYIGSANSRGLKFTLSRNEFAKLIFGDCVYCGSKPSLSVKVRSRNQYLNVNGIDRKDNSLGYTIENSVSCCRFCNQAKGTVSMVEFMEWLSRLCKFQLDSRLLP